MAENKVKFNLKNAHYAVMNVDEDGTVTFETPVAIPGSVSLSLSAKGDTSEFYADGMVYYTATANNGYEGDFEMALIPQTFEPKAFALLFEFDGDVKATRHVMYNCKASRPDVASKTNEDKKEVQTDKLSLTASPLANGNVKTKTTGATANETYTKWYESVYVPVKTGE